MRMSETPDYTKEAGVFQAAMEAALANIDKANADLLKEREKVADLEMAAREELKRIEREATAISQAYMDQHRKEYLEDLRRNVIRKSAIQLILGEVPSLKVKRALELNDEEMASIWMEIGFETFGDTHVAHVGYDDRGISSDVIFYREDISIRFHREYGAEFKSSILHVPTLEDWTTRTGLPPEDRMPVLEFVAHHLIRYQAKQHYYQIGEDTITIVSEP